jgi:hypothetical protein
MTWLPTGVFLLLNVAFTKSFHVIYDFQINSPKPSSMICSTSTKTSSTLFAKKRKETRSSSKGGGGFGAAPKASNTEGKVRSVGSRSGSGTKPLRAAANNFDRLREEFGKESTHDVYCKSPLNDPELLWFVGKVNIRPNTVATPEQAIIAQKRLILEYAKRELRPQNLGGKYASSLELWLAPGDTEMDAVQNKISLKKVDGSTADLLEAFSVSDVGYNPEIYVGDEREKGGLRIKRDNEGNPTAAVFEINE